MNARIRELVDRAGFVRFSAQENPHTPIDWSCDYEVELETLIELIVRECLDLGKQIQSQRVINGSEEYIAGREMGVEVFMNQIKKHLQGES